MSSFEVYLDIRQPAPEAAKPSAGSGAAHMPLRRAVTGQHGAAAAGRFYSFATVLYSAPAAAARSGWWQCRGSFTCGAWRPWTERCATLSTSTSFSGSTTSSGPDRRRRQRAATVSRAAASRRVRRSGGMCGARWQWRRGVMPALLNAAAPFASRLLTPPPPTVTVC